MYSKSDMVQFSCDFQNEVTYFIHQFSVLLILQKPWSLSPET